VTQRHPDFSGFRKLWEDMMEKYAEGYKPVEKMEPTTQERIEKLERQMKDSGFWMEHTYTSLLARVKDWENKADTLQDLIATKDQIIDQLLIRIAQLELQLGKIPETR
jgi:chromosome segregation ATPase